MRYLLGLVCLTATACSPPATTGLSALIVAHRGASHDAPENTIAAFQLAWRQGADAIEGDFHLTSDGHIVCHHDETTKRTAGVDVGVNEQTLAELRRYDVGRWKHDAWAGERIPTLEEVIDSVPADGIILIEIKSDSSVVPALARVIEGAHLDLEQIIVISFDEQVITDVEKLLPLVKTLWLVEFEKDNARRFRPTAPEVVETARRIGADGVDVEARRSVVNESFVQTVRDAGLELHVWTVNDRAVGRRMSQLGVDSITTDRPAWLREQLMRK